MIEFDRRRALISAAGLAVGGMTTARLLPEEMLLRDRRLARSKVAIISAVMYSEGLVDSLTRVLSIFGLNLRHKSVLLKPNLVEYIAGVEVNTNPVLVGAAAQAFLKLGADSVVVGRGSWAPARHISGARRERARRSTAQPEDQFRRSEPRRIVQSANEGHLHGSGTPMAASDCTQVRLRRVDAEDQDPPLGWRHA